MIRFIRNIFVIPELRKRVIFTLLLLAVYRMGSQIVTPGLNSEALQQFFEAAAGHVSSDSWTCFPERTFPG